MKTHSITKAKSCARWLAGCSALGLAASLMTAAPALAQDEETSTVGEIVVTAQFREQKLQDTPLAITAVNAETMEARSQVTIVDVGNQAPNVALRPASGAFGPAMQAYIRGVGQADFNFALEPGVGVYVDDVYYATLTGSILDLMDLDRVEILRGPQGTLAGQNSIGGAIKLYSKKPTGQEGGFAQLTYGDYNRMEFRGAADFSVIEDVLVGRISGVSRQQDGYVTRYDYGCSHPGSPIAPQSISQSCQIGTEGGKDYTGGRLALRWTPSENVDVNFSADYTTDKSEAGPNTLLYVGTPTGPGITPVANDNLTMNGVAYGTATGSPFISYSPYGSFAQDTFSTSPYTSYANYSLDRSGNAAQGNQAAFSVPPVYGVDSWGASLNADIQLTDSLNLQSISAYREYDAAWSVDDASPLPVYLLYNLASHRQFTQEVRLNGVALNDSVNYTVGAFYIDRESYYGGRIGVRTLPTFIENDIIPGKTWAAFGQADWAVNDKLNVIAGIRFTDSEKDFIYGRLGVGGAPAPVQVAGLNGIVGHYDGTNVDYRLVGQYKFTDDFMAYAQYSTGIRGGGVNPRPFSAAQAVAHNPETLDAYEVGAKADFFDGMLRVNTSAFLNKYHDILVTVATCPATAAPPVAPCALPLNAGEATVKGIEAEFWIRPTARFSIDGSIGVLDFSYDSISAAGASSGITLGMSSPFAPDLQYSLGAQYRFDAFGGSLTPRLDLSYQGEFHTNANNNAFNLTPERTLLNGRVTWLDAEGALQVALEVTNLTNELYYHSIRDDRGSSRFVTGYPGAPRMWGMSVKKHF